MWWGRLKNKVMEKIKSQTNVSAFSWCKKTFFTKRKNILNNRKPKIVIKVYKQDTICQLPLLKFKRYVKSFKTSALVVLLYLKKRRKKTTFMH